MSLQPFDISNDIQILLKKLFLLFCLMGKTKLLKNDLKKKFKLNKPILGC